MHVPVGGLGLALLVDKLAIVKAIAKDPETPAFFILDAEIIPRQRLAALLPPFHRDAFGALDPQTRMNMQDLLVRLWREVQATVFFVTHSIEEAVFLGDRVYIFSNAPGTLLRELEVEPANRPSREMQREPRFQETVFYIRDLIGKLEEGKE